MPQYRKKPVVIEAITWTQLVQHGVEQCQQEGRELVNGMPWSFSYKGHPITHENDRCYIVPTPEGSVHMTPDDMLLTGVKGEIYPCKLDIFAATYDRVLPDWQQRVVNERADLFVRYTNLHAFISRNPTFGTLPDGERLRMGRQLQVMHDFVAVLDERIAEF